jgi:hypothetical protein
MDAMTTTDEEQDAVPMYKLALIGDSGEAGHATTACQHHGTHLAGWIAPRPAGVGKTCILLRFAEGGFNVSFMSTVGCVLSTGYSSRAVPSTPNCSYIPSAIDTVG